MSVKQKVLVIGASSLQEPAILCAHKHGCEVAAVDFNPNAVGVALADKFYNVSTNDISGVIAVARDFRPDGIMTIATDMPMRSIAAACEAMGLPGISRDAAFKSTDKAAMIAAFEASDVPHPSFQVLDAGADYQLVLDRVPYPCIVKPTDNSGSRGVVLVEHRDDFVQACRYASGQSRGGRIMVEEYMCGPEVSVEVFVVNGVPHVLAVTDKLTTGAPHFVEMGHSQPSALSVDALEQIRDLAKRAVLAVGITMGPAHVEIILTKEGPKMVELGARMGGDCITTHLVPLSTGVDMVESTLLSACGLTPDIEPKFAKGSAIRFLEVRPGVLAGIEGVDKARAVPGVVEVQITKDVGSEIEGLNSSLDRIGAVIAQADSAREAIAVCERALQLIKVSYR